MANLDPLPLGWRKSTATESGTCVEVAFDGHFLLIRNSNDPSGPKLAFLCSEWTAFVADVKNGKFDID